METRNDLLTQIRNLLAGGSTSLDVVSERIGVFATPDEQAPTGTGVGGKIRVHYGNGGNTDGGEFTVQPDGTILCNVSGTQYTFDIVVRPSRLGGGGNAIIMGRFMYSANGTETDTVQIGGSYGVRIDDDNTIWREAFSDGFIPAAGSHLWLEIARDGAGADDGELNADQPSGNLTTDTPPWNPVATASVTISTLKVKDSA